jgi:hypothetical protein
MLDFTPIRTKQFPLPELVAREHLEPSDLRRLTNELVDTMLNLMDACEDADVVFEPSDPAAYDSYAATEEELKISWTLGHVIVHTTASAEESAFLAAELARGVPHHPGRSRYEVPWQTVRRLRNAMRVWKKVARCVSRRWMCGPHRPILKISMFHAKDCRLLMPLRGLSAA